MHLVIQLLLLFAAAVALALFAGDNQGVVSVFWPPWRVDLSLNLVLLLLAGGFVLVYAAIRGLARLRALPQQARQWRLLQRERAVQRLLTDGVAWERAGRYSRARRSALEALRLLQSSALASALAPDTLAAQRAQAHLAAADAAHALQDRATRDEHLRHLLGTSTATETPPRAQPAPPAAWLEAARLRAAQWALDDNDASAALDWLASLPPGAQRRMLALRLRLRAARISGRLELALETARLLVKHRAYTDEAGASLLRGLVIEILQQTHDTDQVAQRWQQLTPAERAMPEVALAAARRLRSLNGDAALARRWLEPVWVAVFESRSDAADALRAALVDGLAQCLVTPDEAGDRSWLARIEAAQQQQPRDGYLQYLAGMACQQRGLWGKAEQLLGQAVVSLPPGATRRAAWRAVAERAEQRGDLEAARRAWQHAATDA